KSAQIREILISESAWEEMTCLFAPSVSFDANDPVSIETAIQEAYSMLEERASRYAANPMISPMIEAMKEDLRQQILDSAEQQRQENGQDGN
ncbi:hypothetical protein ABEK68_28150, partial [Klebsiella pneumoniae]